MPLSVATLIANPATPILDEAIVTRARDAIGAANGRPGGVDVLAPGIAVDIPFEGIDPRLATDGIKAALGTVAVDVVAQVAATRRKRLLIADMDSTIVTGETLDELAAVAGIGDQVAAITARAMNGEIPFEDALRQRVAMLKGHPTTLLDAALRSITLSPGAKTLVRTMKANGATTILISGGFDYFVDRIAARCGFDLHECNRLIIRDGHLTGMVAEPILGKERKMQALLEHAQATGSALAECATIGDGANDLAMLTAASDAGGIGAAYRAKPTVRAHARHVIDHGDLTALLYAQGYRDADFSHDDG